MTTFRLAAPSAPPRVPTLDPHQQAVVDHESGPLLVLAGPGTGKTTTLVEAIVDRIERRGVAPESVLALTFSRKVAEQLRDRVTARLGRTVGGQLCMTFHSFAYSLIREFAPTELYAAPLRLITSAEQEVRLGELLADHPESVHWPEQFATAARTRGFVREVAAVLGRAREHGLEPDQLRALGEEHQLPEFVAAGWFLEQYLSTLDSLGATDYADLIRRAVIEARDHRAELRARFSCLFVDEYQDTDPGQVALLRAIAGDGRDLVVVGDPHQSIYGFRGADVRGILDFPSSFPTVTGDPAPVRVLRTTRRFGPALLDVSQQVASRLPLHGSIAADDQRAFRHPEPVEGAEPGVVEVLTYDTERAEIERMADLLRRAHLEDGVPWSQMAVLVRSGRAMIPLLRRSLGAAGVPVETASDETPLVREPAVAPLLAALQALVSPIDVDTAPTLLTSPLVGLDPSEVRAVARSLRLGDRTKASGEHLRDALTGGPTGDAPASVAVAGFASVLAEGRRMLEEGATTEQLLWHLWQSSTWPHRLRAQVERGGAAAQRAHRDLDAVCVLFDVAAKAEEQRGHTSVENFLATITAQDIPADTLADRGVRGEAVRLMTAHRSKGLEWDLVVVAHAQEGSWPDLRRRTSLLRADRIGAAGYGSPTMQEPVTSRELLAEERRLFYVACTRARRRLVVTAVQSVEDDGDQPSRFLSETGIPAIHHHGRPPRPLTFSGLIAELRRTLADESTPEPLREAAARWLAALAQTRVHGRQVAAAADPATWWGLREWSAAEEPVRPADQPIRLSASTLTAMAECPARWFLDREAGGATGATQAQGFGNVVHALAEQVTKGAVGERPTIDDLEPLVDRVWDQIAFRTPWSSARERQQVRAALTRFLNHHQRAGAPTVLGTEMALSTEVTLPDGQKVRLHGYADRIEVDAEGRVNVVDLKTTKYHPREKELEEHPQLGLYQYAVTHGALAEVPGHSGVTSGAELWQLRTDKLAGGIKVQRQDPQTPDDDGVLPVERQLMAAADAIRREEFWARPGDHCKFCAFAQLCPSQVSGTVLS